MNRVLILLFAIVAYGVFFATFLYLVAFVGNLQHTRLTEWLPWLPALVPQSIDAGRAGGPFALALAIDLGLIALFGLQHSAMARTGFKAWLKRRLPGSAERSVYVLIASLVLILLFWQWRPMPTLVWAAQSGTGQAIGWAVFGLGFAVVLLSTFLIDHFDLFGLKPAWRGFTGRAAEAPRFVTPLFYRLVRHPLYLGFILAFWGGPVMSVGHLVFAVAMTLYILIAIQLEERDLLRQLGDSYQRYRQQVPMLVPRPWRRRTSDI
jgi:methanethiol S-methyltransferase